MDDNRVYKEVYFNQYCKTCKHRDVKEADDPCDECLDNPLNVESHKPVKWEENDKKGRTNERRN